MRTYGTLARSNGRWVLQAEPHVIIRVKRLLPRANPQRSGYLFISDTPEVARDLQWLLGRWRLRMSMPDLYYLDAQSTVHREQEQLVSAIQKGHRLQGDFLQPAVEPRGYQLEASDILLSTGRYLVVHSIGLGKTFTGLLALREPKAHPMLVVTLGGQMPMQWLGQTRRFFPELSAAILPRGEITEASWAAWAGLDVLIVPYSRLDKYAPLLAGHARSVVYDEIQELRRYQSLKYIAAGAISDAADYVIGLTATPIYGYAGEMHAIMDIIAPGSLGDRGEFMREWAGHAVGLGGSIALSESGALGSHLREEGLMDVKSRVDVGMELEEPELLIQPVEVDLGWIEEAERELAEVARRLLAGVQTQQERFELGQEMDWKMREATGVAKAFHVADFVRLLLDSESKVLLFGWHRRVYDIWNEVFERWEIPAVMFTGTESDKAKGESLRSFLDPAGARVMMMSLRSGAGLDGLQEVCSVAVFGELDWAPGIHTQGVGRLARDGQPNGVVAFFCTTEYGSDPLVTEVLGIKQQQADAIVNLGHRLAATPTLSNADRVRRLAESVLGRGK